MYDDSTSTLHLPRSRWHRFSHPPRADVRERKDGKAHRLKAAENHELPGGRISETLLEFAAPLPEAAGNAAGQPQIESVLRVACTVWNAVVLDAVNGNTRFVDELRRRTAIHPGPAVVVEQLIMRKRTSFADDYRAIGNHELCQKGGEWVLRAEARDPRRLAQ